MRYELSDSECSVIDAMLPNKPRGVPRVDDRRVLDRAHPGGTCRLSSSGTAKSAQLGCSIRPG